MVNKIQFIILWILAFSIAITFWSSYDFIDSIKNVLGTAVIGFILLVTFSEHNPFGKKKQK